MTSRRSAQVRDDERFERLAGRFWEVVTEMVESIGWDELLAQIEAAREEGKAKR